MNDWSDWMKCEKLLIKTSSFVSVTPSTHFVSQMLKGWKWMKTILWKNCVTFLSITSLFDMFTHFLLPFFLFICFFLFLFLLKMNKVDICCASCQGTGSMRNKRKTTNIASFVGHKHLPFITSTKAPVIMIMLMLAVVVSVLGDDTQALRDTLSSLCSLNSLGKFGSCCESYDISSVTLASSAARNCFLSSLSSTSGSVTDLFVFQLFF